MGRAGVRAKRAWFFGWSGRREAPVFAAIARTYAPEVNSSLIVSRQDPIIPLFGEIINRTYVYPAFLYEYPGFLAVTPVAKRT
jgi:hypothetical protein